MISDYLKWHIIQKEKKSNIEAYYIHCIINYYKDTLKENYKLVLDIPCGNGRLIPYLRSFGYDVYGVDISEELINECKKKYPDLSNKLFIGDMRNFCFSKKFDVLLNWYSSFGYFDEEDNLKTMKNFNKLLRTGGILILEDVNPEKVENQNLFFDYGEIVEFCEIKIEKNYRIFLEKYFKKDGKNLIFLEDFVIKVRLYTYEEYNKLFELCGFKLLNAYEYLSFREYRSDSSRVVYIALKVNEVV
ncbi:MAG: class I SAM-dependent methyltransferase [Candidatus Aenigmatarchaeota archaeon]